MPNCGKESNTGSKKQGKASPNRKCRQDRVSSCGAMVSKKQKNARHAAKACGRRLRKPWFLLPIGVSEPQPDLVEQGR